MKPERRKPTDFEIAMVVIKSMRGFGYLLYGALALCLIGSIAVGFFTGKWELAIVTALISSVSGGANAAGGFMAGVLSQTRPQNPVPEPVPVTTLPGDKVETAPASKAPDASSEETPDDH